MTDEKKCSDHHFSPPQQDYQLGRRYIGIDISRKYLDDSLRNRLAQTALLDGGAA